MTLERRKKVLRPLIPLKFQVILTPIPLRNAVRKPIQLRYACSRCALAPLCRFARAVFVGLFLFHLVPNLYRLHPRPATFAGRAGRSLLTKNRCGFLLVVSLPLLPRPWCSLRLRSGFAPMQSGRRRREQAQGTNAGAGIFEKFKNVGVFLLCLTQAQKKNSYLSCGLFHFLPAVPLCAVAFFVADPRHSPATGSATTPKIA